MTQFFLNKSLFNKVAAPTFPDRERTLAARWLNVYLIVAFFFLVVTFILLLFGIWAHAMQRLMLLACGTLLTINSICWLLMRRGMIKTASFLVLATIFTIATYLNIFVFQTVHSPDVWVYFVLIPLSGLLLSRKMMAYFCGACVAATGITFYLEFTGVITPAIATRTSVDHFIVLASTLSMSTILLYSAIRKVEEKAEEAKASLLALLDSNRRLEQSEAALRRAHNELEERVIERTHELRAANHLLQDEIIVRQELMDALSSSEAHWRTLVENAPELIITADIDGKVVFINRPAVGASPVLPVGAPLIQLHQDPKVQELLSDALQRVLLTGEAVSYESEEQINQVSIWRINRIGAIQQKGVVHAFILISTDITEQKQTEAAMQRSQKLESLGLMAGGVAHDFNNLLAAMLGQATLAMNKLASQNPAYEHLQSLIMAGHRATDLTRQMLNYAGRGSTDTQRIDLNNLIKENVQFFSASVPRTIALIANPMADLPLIEGDPGQVQQLLMNLILNGADAIGDQVGSITINTQRRYLHGDESSYWRWTGRALPPGHYIELSVQDTGCGMESHTLERIFDPFFTTKFTGRGLGLASVLGIVRAHKGGMHVVSTPGKGTTFHMVFPTSEATAYPEQVSVALETEVDLEGKTVLIVDDEDDVREVTAEILMLSGLRTLTAANGAAALDLFARHQPEIDLVLLDLSMPGMTGEQVVTVLWQRSPSLPIILLSGYDEHEVSRRLGANNRAAFLQKPYTVENMLAKIRQQLAEARLPA